MSETRPMSPLRKFYWWLRWYEPRFALAYTLIVLAGWLWLGWPLLWPGLVALLLMGLAVDSVVRAGSSWFIATVSRGPRGGDAVALSFDDGPDPQVTPAVLEQLKRHGARATFFVIGRQLAAHPELGRRIVAEGHVVANHSWQHSYLQNFRLREWQTAEISRAERAIEEVTGQASTRLYRPPVGMKTGDQARAVGALGLKVIAWSVHSRDTVDPDPVSMARRVLRHIRGGDIVLLHDGDRVPGRRQSCAEAVRLILEGLHAKGLRAVTVPELLGYPPPRAQEPLPERLEALP
ncbi:MAG TPA: polysaccharide deacetylase family protein [Gammaproteobacteria bacterium]|nr:polysaccharide deacetylase family protein [Gammaproteobacteria bacterium]